MVRVELTSDLCAVCRIVIGAVACVSSPGIGEAVHGNAGARCWGVLWPRATFGCGENLVVLPYVNPL